MPSTEQRKCEIERLSGLIESYRRLKETLVMLRTQPMQTSLPLYDGLAFQPAIISQSNNTTIALGQGYFAEVSVDAALGIIDRKVAVIDSLVFKEGKLVELQAKLATLDGEEVNEDGEKFVDIREDVAISEADGLIPVIKLPVKPKTEKVYTKFDLNLLKMLNELDVDNPNVIDDHGIQVFDSDGEDVMKHETKKVKFNSVLMKRTVCKKSETELVSILKAEKEMPLRVTDMQKQMGKMSIVPNENVRKNMIGIDGKKERDIHLVELGLDNGVKCIANDTNVIDNNVMSTETGVAFSSSKSIIKRKPEKVSHGVFKDSRVIENELSNSDSDCTYDSEDDMETQLVHRQVAAQYHRKRQQLISAGLIKGDLDEGFEDDDYSDRGTSPEPGNLGENQKISLFKAGLSRY